MLKLTSVLIGISLAFCTPQKHSIQKAPSTGDHNQALLDNAGIYDSDERNHITQQIVNIEEDIKSESYSEPKSNETTEGNEKLNSIDISHHEDNISFNSASEDGGFIDGNSGNYITFQNNPWFLANVGNDGQAFSFCIKADENDYSSLYSLPLNDAKELILKGLKQWDDLLIDVKKAGYLDANKIISELEWSENKIIDKSNKEIVSKFTEISCDKNPDLTFLLADYTHEDILKIKGIDQKIGMSIRTSFDQEKNWSRGIIWIAPDLKNSIDLFKKGIWKELWKFHAILLHELGHVFGFPHDSVEIMMETFPLEVATNSLDHFQHILYFDNNTQPLKLLSPKSILGQSWLFNNEIEHFIYDQEKNNLTTDQVSQMYDTSGKKVFNGFPKEVALILGKNGVLNSGLKVINTTEYMKSKNLQMRVSKVVLGFQHEVIDGWGVWWTPSFGQKIT